jgi:hypothetical protein
MVDGTYTVEVTDTDTAGNTASASITFTLDTTAPTAPANMALSDNVAHDLNSASGLGALASHHRTNDTTPTLSGTVEANAVVKIYNGSTLLTTLNANGSGAWSYTPAALAQGNYTLTATATDAAGNTSAASNSLGFTVDTLATATLSGMTIDSGRDGRTDLPVTTDRYTYDDTPQFNISTEAGATVFISSDTAGQNRISNGVIVTESVTTPGTFDVRTTVPLAQGVYYLNAEDQAGNWTQFSSFTVDTVAQSPALAMQSAAPITVPTGASNAFGTNLQSDWTINHDEATGNVTLTFSNIEGTGEVRNVFLNGGTLAGTNLSLPLELIATQSGDHTVWTATLAPEEVALLNDGALTLTAQHVDLAGNISTSTHAVTLDTFAPTVADTSKIEIIDNTPGMYVGQAVPTTNPIANMNDPTPTFVGAARSVEGGSTVWIYDTFGSSPKALLGSVIAAADGSWSYTAADMSVQQGNHSITYVSTDVAGNLSAETTAAQTFKLVLLPMVTALSITPVTDGNTGDNVVNRTDMSVAATPADTFVTADATQVIHATLNNPLGSGESLWGSVDGGASWVNISSSVSGTAVTWAATLGIAISEIQIQARDTSWPAYGGVVAKQATDLQAIITVDNTHVFIDGNGNGTYDNGESTINFVPSGDPQTLNATTQDIDLANGRVLIHFNNVPTAALNLAGFGDDDKIEIDIQAFVANDVWMSKTESSNASVNYDLTNPVADVGNVTNPHPLTKFDLQGILPHSLAQTANGYKFAGAHAAISYAGNSPGFTSAIAKTGWVRYDANGQLLQLPYFNRWITPQAETAGPPLATNLTLSNLSNVSFVNYPDIWVGVDADGVYFDADHDGRRDVTTAYSIAGTTAAGAADLDVHAAWLASGEENNITLEAIDFQKARVIMQVNDVADSGALNLTGFGTDDRIIFNIGNLIENGVFSYGANQGATAVLAGNRMGYSLNHNGAGRGWIRHTNVGNTLKLAHDSVATPNIAGSGAAYSFANWADADNPLANFANYYQAAQFAALNSNKALSAMLAAPQIVDIVLPTPVHVIVNAAGQWIDANGNGVLDGTDAATHADFGLGGNASLVSKEVTIRFFDKPTYNIDVNSTPVPLNLSSFNGDDKIELDMAELYTNVFKAAGKTRGLFYAANSREAISSAGVRTRVNNSNGAGAWVSDTITPMTKLYLKVNSNSKLAQLASNLHLVNGQTQLNAVNFIPNPLQGFMGVGAAQDARIVIVDTVDFVSGVNPTSNTAANGNNGIYDIDGVGAGTAFNGAWVDTDRSATLALIPDNADHLDWTAAYGSGGLDGFDSAYLQGSGALPDGTAIGATDTDNVDLNTKTVLVVVKDIPYRALNLTGFDATDKLVFDVAALVANGVLKNDKLTSITYVTQGAGVTNPDHRSINPVGGIKVANYHFSGGTDIVFHYATAAVGNDFAGVAANKAGGYIEIKQLTGAVNGHNSGVIAQWDAAGFTQGGAIRITGHEILNPFLAGPGYNAQLAAYQLVNGIGTDNVQTQVHQVDFINASGPALAEDLWRVDGTFGTSIYLDADRDGTRDTGETSFTLDVGGTDKAAIATAMDLVHSSVVVAFDGMPKGALDLTGFGTDDRIVIDLFAAIRGGQGYGSSTFTGYAYNGIFGFAAHTITLQKSLAHVNKVKFDTVGDSVYLTNGNIANRVVLGTWSANDHGLEANIASFTAHGVNMTGGAHVDFINVHPAVPG